MGFLPVLLSLWLLVDRTADLLPARIQEIHPLLSQVQGCPGHWGAQPLMRSCRPHHHLELNHCSFYLFLYLSQNYG